MTKSAPQWLSDLRRRGQIPTRKYQDKDGVEK